MSCGCPDKYSLNGATGLCEFVKLTPAEYTTSPVLPTQVCAQAYYGNKGTAVYAPITPEQFPLTGKHVVAPTFQDALGDNITPIGHLISGNLWISNLKAYNGRLNQAGIGLLPPTSQWQGYSRCITIEEGDQISVCLGASRAFRLYVDNILAVDYHPANPVRVSDYLHVFPLDLPVGSHNITFEGLSETTIKECYDSNGFKVQCGSASAVTVDGGCLGAFVGEVYLNVDIIILSGIKDQDQLNSFYAKHIKNGIGENVTTLILKGSPTDTGFHGNYNCTGSSITNCIEGLFYCREVLTASPGACCFTLTNCETGATIITNTNLNAYLNYTIKISGYSGCFLITPNSTVGCSGAIAVAVTAFYINCVECRKVYYKLIDCTGNIDPLYTTSDLSEYFNKVIKIEGYNACWLVVIDEETTQLMTPVIIDSFNTCEECL